MDSAGAIITAAGGADAAAPSAATLAQAYAWCGRLARAHYENFTIASWLMPRAMRPHMHAIYAYARIADDFADEALADDGAPAQGIAGESLPADNLIDQRRRLAKLDAWERELDAAYAGAPHHPVFVALADTARRFEIPREPFADLLRAFRADVTFTGFDTIDDLLGYARYSANPVGRLVLYLFGYRDAARRQLSDLVCSGLQLANFWQDVAIDFDKGRIYFPRRDLERFGVAPDHLRDRRVTPQFVDLMRHEIAVARDLLMRGAALGQLVDRRLRRDILMFAGGGLAILRAIEKIDYDVFNQRPKLGRLGYLALGWDAIRGRLSY